MRKAAEGSIKLIYFFVGRSSRKDLCGRIPRKDFQCGIGICGRIPRKDFVEGFRKDPRKDPRGRKKDSLPVQAATGGRSGVSVYKAGRSVPLDSAQLDLSRLALPQLGSAGVEKCLQIHVPSSGLKTQKNRKRPKMHFTNRIRALAANLLQNVVRQETTRIRVPSPSFPNAQKIEHRNFFYTTASSIIGSTKK